MCDVKAEYGDAGMNWESEIGKYQSYDSIGTSSSLIKNMCFYGDRLTCFREKGPPFWLLDLIMKKDYGCTYQHAISGPTDTKYEAEAGQMTSLLNEVSLDRLV